MAFFTMPRHERVAIDGKTYYVCADCRLPLATAHDSLFPIAIPGKGMPGSDDPRQVLCDPCYRKQYLFLYPTAEQPPVHGSEFHPVPGMEKVP